MDGGNIFLTLLEKFAPEGVPSWILALSAAGVGIGILVGFVSVLVMFAVWLERRSPDTSSAATARCTRAAGTAGPSRSRTG